MNLILLLLPFPDEIQSSEDFRRLFASAIATYETAELAVLWLMREYRFDLSILQQALIGSVLPFYPFNMT